MAVALFSCSERVENADPLQEVIQSAPAFVREMIDSVDYEIQILYTQVERDDKNTPVLYSFDINRSDDIYFYPASTVKMPVKDIYPNQQKPSTVRRPPGIRLWPTISKRYSA